MHLLFKLRRLPSFGPPIEHLNADPRTRFSTTLALDSELQEASYEASRRGEVPQHPPVGMQIPTVMDPSLAPERAIFSSDRFAAMQGATNGDFTHGLIHPEQMIGGRLLVPGSAHATPIANLYLCGASCHPGPGVTFLPGYGAAYEVAEALGTLTRSSARSAA